MIARCECGALIHSKNPCIAVYVDFSYSQCGRWLLNIAPLNTICGNNNNNNSNNNNNNINSNNNNNNL